MIKINQTVTIDIIRMSYFYFVVLIYWVGRRALAIPIIEPNQLLIYIHLTANEYGEVRNTA